MASFPNTLIRCIAEGRTPDEPDITEIASHIWKDMNGSAAVELRNGGGRALRTIARAALCGSFVPHLDDAIDRERRLRATGDGRAHSASVVRSRHMMMARILLADGGHREKAWP